MPFYIKWIIVAIEAYLLGSLSFSIIVSKGLYKQDIRTFGSGNAGMTNILRTFGKKAAALTITGDVLKGTVAVLIARLLFMNEPVLLIHRYAFTLFGREIFFSNQITMEIALYIAVLGAVLGHMFPIYFGFKGGKGIVCGLAVAIVLDWRIALGILGLFVVVFAISRYVSLGSVLASFGFGVGFAVLHHDNIYLVTGGIFLAALAVFMQRGNIKRLIDGTEKKVHLIHREKNKE
jgi:glycerol-3-phosphate acyltransferase PlsY